MRKQITLRIILVLIVLIFAMLPVAALAEDTYVHAESPGYDIVVGKDVTFKWYDTLTVRDQDSFELNGNGMIAWANGSFQEVTWPNFPFGTGYWDVKIYNKEDRKPISWIGTTSRQNFYHYNNIPNTTNYRPEPFEYKRGFRSPRTLSDYTVFFELTKDYRIDIASYFTDLEKLPEPIDWDDEYEKTELHRQDLYEHAKALPNMESDFLKLDGGVLTIKQGYRWDGTSNPGVGEEESSDLRSSCVHDAIYDLIRMEYLARDEENHFNWVWNEAGYMNRLVADTMHFLIAVEDKDKSVTDARSDWRTLRKLARANTGYDYLLRAFKYHVSELTAWVTDDGKVDLHWMPANKTDVPDKVDDDPKNYRNRPHNYDIYRTTSNSSEWDYIGSKTFYPDDMLYHTDANVYFTDPNVINGEIYYYWIRANDPDYDGDGWTDQEEDDYANGNWKRDWIHPNYRKRHYDESVVEAVVPAIGPGNALQLNGVDQYVISTSEPGINSGDSWTFEVWVCPEEGNGLSTILALSGLDPIYTGNYTPLMYDDVNNRFCYSDGDIEACNDNGSIASGFWYHLAVTIDGSDGVLYVNGVPETTFTTDKWPEATPTFGIGASFDIDKVWDPEGGEYETGAYAYKNILTDFFKGKIDELRVWSIARTEKEIRDNMFVPLRGDHEDLVALWHFDEPDGTHTAYDATINGRDGEIHEARFVVSDAMMMAPEVDAGPDETINEGDTFVGSGFFTDPDSSTWTATVDYGDGSGVQSLTLTGDTFDLSHIYAEDGLYTVTVEVTDDDGGVGTDTVQVTVNNVAPAVDAGPDVTINEADTFTGSGSFTDPGADTWTATVDYGDGSGDQPLTLTDDTFDLSHIYADNGIYTVTVTVTDDDGGVGTDLVLVTVNNVAPTASIDSVDQPNPHFILPVVHTLTFNGSFTDPGWLDVHEANWNFDDGTVVAGTLTEENTPPDSTGNSTSQHAYSAPGNYTVTLSIMDDDGGVGTDTMVKIVISSEEAITVINNSIQDLPKDAFKSNSDNRKNAFSKKLDAVVKLINAGAYQSAIDKLQDDIRAKVDGYVEGNPKNDWIIDQGAQEKLCTMIDDLIAYLETML